MARFGGRVILTDTAGGHPGIGPIHHIVFAVPMPPHSRTASTFTPPQSLAGQRTQFVLHVENCPYSKRYKTVCPVQTFLLKCNQKGNNFRGADVVVALRYFARVQRQRWWPTDDRDC